MVLKDEHVCVEKSSKALANPNATIWLQRSPFEGDRNKELQVTSPTVFERMADSTPRPAAVSATVAASPSEMLSMQWQRTWGAGPPPKPPLPQKLWD